MSEATERLLGIMALLRDRKEGCPWDVEQSFATIAPHTIEEAYEVADAAERGDMASLKDELGDLLLQVVFHAQMAKEGRFFDFEAVAAAICDKLVRRHPHVFGDATIADAEAQTEAWEVHKADERKRKAAGTLSSALEGVSVALPALLRADKLQKRAARTGFDWNHPVEVLSKIAEETGELAREMGANAGRDRLEDEIGDLLFSIVNLGRKLGLDSETALRRANAKFERRFRQMELAIIAAGRSLEGMDLAEMEAFWQRAKAEV